MTDLENRAETCNTCKIADFYCTEEDKLMQHIGNFEFGAVHTSRQERSLF